MQTVALYLCDIQYVYNVRQFFWPDQKNQPYLQFCFEFIYYEGHFRSNVNVIILAYCMLFTSKAVYHRKHQPKGVWTELISMMHNSHASTRANVSTVSKHWKCLFSGCNAYLLIAPKMYKRITRKWKRELCCCNLNKLHEQLSWNQFCRVLKIMNNYIMSTFTR